MLVTLLMLTLLLGPIVLVFWLGSLPFWAPYIGHLALLIWVILGSPFLELLILFEQWAGHRLLSEKVIRPHVRAGRPISFPSVPVSEGIEIRHGCVSFLVAYFVHLVSYQEDLVDFCLADLVLICLG